MFNPLKPTLREKFNLSPVPRALRHTYHDARVRVRRAVSATSDTDLAKAWWYYGVELLPGVFTKGIYASDFPFGPRILTRKCDLAGMDCIDIGAMEGVLPVLMRRGGARKVVAADATFHCYEKLTALQRQYEAPFDFQQIGLMYDLSDKLAGQGGFDLVVLAGVLYHVFSPLHTLAGVRPLLKKNGIFILSTNVIRRADLSMDFNDRGRFQPELNTFWYLTVPLLEYMLRYFKLVPIDCTYVPHEATHIYAPGVDSGLITVACRAVEDDAVAKDDTWARESPASSWEYGILCDLEKMNGQPRSPIHYTEPLDPAVLHADGRSIDLLRAVKERPPTRARGPEDTYLLRRSDQS